MRRTTRRSARAAWWHYYSLVFSHSRVVKIIMFLGVKVRKRAKNGKRRAACFLFSKNRRRETKHWSNSQQSSFRLSSFHKKKKKKTHQIIFHHGAEFFLLEQRLVREDIRADTSQRSRCVHYTLRALSLSFYFSLSRPRRTAEIIIGDAFRGRDYISDWHTLLFSLSVY